VRNCIESLLEIYVDYISQVLSLNQQCQNNVKVLNCFWVISE